MDIVCFGSDWDGHPSTVHHLLRRLAQRHRVLWVNSLGMRTPNLRSAHDLRRLLERGTRLLQHAIPREDPSIPGFWVIDPLYIPMQQSELMRGANRQILGWQLQQTLRWLKFRKPVVITALPNSFDAIRVIRPSACIYYCLDDFSQMPGVAPEVARQEAILVRQSDFVMVTAEPLKERLAHLGTPIEILRQGVDLKRFRNPCPVPENIACLPRPRLGFFGALDHWLDLDLIAEVARERPDWCFPIVGPTRVDTSMFDGLSNVTLLGAVPYETIPGVAAGFDIGLLPFEVNSFTEAVNPLKLREYFAAGVPAVSTSLPEVKAFEPLVKIADTKEETIQAVVSLLANPPSKESLLDAVAGDGWGARANEFESWFRSYCS